MFALSPQIDDCLNVLVAFPLSLENQFSWLQFTMSVRSLRFV